MVRITMHMSDLLFILEWNFSRWLLSAAESCHKKLSKPLVLHFELKSFVVFSNLLFFRFVPGKFTPIPGFLHFSAPETLPEHSPSPEDCLPRDHRFDELASVFGWPFVTSLGDLKYFMVGCGALGCEFLKNFALNGICCGPAGKLTVTDADRIELSNLTRQFLFREHNVGQPKSRAAGVMARQMNSALAVESLELFVGPRTEETFNDSFWMGLDGVCNALDNMEARHYVDKQCVKYEKSLLESGTMGTGGNIGTKHLRVISIEFSNSFSFADTICPFKTKTYGEGGAAVEDGGVPMCTLRNFPQITDHCIEWARDQFALLFTKLIKFTESYLSDPASFEEEIKSLSDTSQAIMTIRSVTSLVKVIAQPSIGAVAQTAFDLFHFLFRDKILDLQNTFPIDKRITGKDGVDKGPFWGEKKRFPTVAVFDPRDDAHTSFLLGATCLLGVSVGLISPKEEDDENWLKDYRDPNFIATMSRSLSLPEYIFCPVATEESASSAEASSEIATTPSMNKIEIVDSLLQKLAAVATGVTCPPSLSVAEFEKDDDFNFHISFVTAAANLRCDNYSIKRTDFHSCKVIAGKIIAALATTTAAVCGLVILELIKLLQKKPTDSYMNRQIGLATNTFTSFTEDPPSTFSTFTETTIPGPEELPVDAYNEQGVLLEEFVLKTVKRAYPEKHSVWNKIVCPGHLTLQEFSDWLAVEHKLKLVSWDFIVGYKAVKDEEGKGNGTAGVSSPVYPPKLLLDYSLLPNLELSLGEATRAIMKSPAAKPNQQYIQLWKECKAAGAIPSFAPDAAVLITSSTTIIQVLSRMEAIGIAGEEAKTLDTRTVTGVEKRQFWVVPGSEAPTCLDLETGEEIDKLASIKFELVM